MRGALLCTLGACLLWIGYFWLTWHSSSFMALFCGAAAGWGATTVSRTHGRAVGAIAAACALLGVAATTWITFLIMRAQVSRQTRIDGDAISWEERRATLTNAAVERGMSYLEFLTSSGWVLAVMVLFALLGVAYAYSIGHGGAADSGE